MAFRMSGFGAGAQEKKEMIPTYEADVRTIVPRKSLVQVRFPGKGILNLKTKIWMRTI